MLHGPASSTKDRTTVGADALLHGQTAENSKWKEHDGTENAETAVLILQHTNLKRTQDKGSKFSENFQKY